MFSKLVKGEIDLKTTFWKYGILGLIILKFAVAISHNLLAGYLNGNTLLVYFTKYFHPIYSPKFSILWALCYVSSLLLLTVYSWNIVLAVWRSSAAYDKSVWLSFLARIFIVLMLVMVWSSVSLAPLF